MKKFVVIVMQNGQPTHFVRDNYRFDTEEDARAYAEQLAVKYASEQFAVARIFWCTETVVSISGKFVE